MTITTRFFGRQSRPRWAPDPNGLFGGQQLVCRRGGDYVAGTYGSVDNWSASNVRAHEAEWPFLTRAAAASVRLVWLNDINDMAASGSGVTAATPLVQLGLVHPDGSTVDALDLRTLAAPDNSLGTGESSTVAVAPRDGVFAVPPAPLSLSRGDTVRGRLFVDRHTDTTSTRLPLQGSQVSADTNANGASQAVIGAGTSHVHNSTTAWSGLGYTANGLIVPAGVIGTVDHPISNVLILGDSIESTMLDNATIPNYGTAYVKRAIETMADSGKEITSWNMAQIGETLNNLLTTLQVTTNARRRLLAAGCWSHVFVGHGRNDVSAGRTAVQITDDYTTLAALVRSIVPAHTQIFLGTVPPRTNGSNATNSLSTVTSDVLTWQLGTGPTLFDHVFDVGATNASASNRMRWKSVVLGDSENLIQDGLHPGAFGHGYMASVLTAQTALWTPVGA